MRPLFLSVLLLTCLTLVGCSSDSYQTNSEEAYDIGNPYSAGSGHYAGYEWAESKGVSSCGGNSQSFIEGCEEYLSQTGGY